MIDLLLMLSLFETLILLHFWKTKWIYSVSEGYLIEKLCNCANENLLELEIEGG